MGLVAIQHQELLEKAKEANQQLTYAKENSIESFKNEKIDLAKNQIIQIIKELEAEFDEKTRV